MQLRLFRCPHQNSIRSPAASFRPSALNAAHSKLDEPAKLLSSLPVWASHSHETVSGGRYDSLAIRAEAYADTFASMASQLDEFLGALQGTIRSWPDPSTINRWLESFVTETLEIRDIPADEETSSPDRAFLMIKASRLWLVVISHSPQGEYSRISPPSNRVTS